MNQDPNITTEELNAMTDNVNSDIRNYIEEALKIFRSTSDTVESDSATIKAGRDEDLALQQALIQSEAGEFSNAGSDLWESGAEPAATADTTTTDTTTTDTTTDTTDTGGTE